jgi:hypothetical protein
MSVLKLATAVSMAAFLHACGSTADSLPVVTAGGKVTYQGLPLDGATLVFAPADGKHVGSALTDGEGRFTIQTNSQEGALPGSYKVIVTKILFTEPVLAPGEHVPTPGTSKSLLPEKYGKLESTDLSVTVPEDGSDSLELVIP